MAYSKTIVCLANSKKWKGLCVAGLELSSSGSAGEWIRPVSDRADQEIQKVETRYADGSYLDLLDVVSVPMLEPKPVAFQTENHLIVPGEPWVKRGTFNPKQLQALCSEPTALWSNGPRSYHGVNDKVPESAAPGFSHSLVLVEPKDLFIDVVLDYQKQKQVRAYFRVGQAFYNCAVTDLKVEAEFSGREVGGRWTYGRPAVACISLTEKPLQGNHIKLVASIIDV